MEGGGLAWRMTATSSPLLGMPLAYHGGPTTRAARRTMDVVVKVEQSQGHLEGAALCRKATKLCAHVLLVALADRIHELRWQEALKVFQLLREQVWYTPEVGTYIRLINMLGKCEKPELAYSLFQLMIEEKCAPTVEVWTALLCAYTRNNLLGMAISIFQHMKSMPDCYPDTFTYTSIIKAHCDSCLFDKAMVLFSEMKAVGVRPSVVTYNTLLHAYGRVGMLENMEDVFQSLLKDKENKPDSYSMNAIIRSFAIRGDIEKMQELYLKFQNAGVEPDTATFNIMLSAYAKKGLYRKMNSVLGYMFKYHYRRDTITHNILIDAYGKAGLICSMERIYRRMRTEHLLPNACTFYALITAYGNKGLWNKVEKICKQILGTDIKADAALLNSVINAYRKTGSTSNLETLLRNERYEQEDIQNGLGSLRNLNMGDTYEGGIHGT